MASGQLTAPTPARMPATRKAATAVAVMPGAVLLYAERTCSARMRSSSSMLFVVMPRGIVRPRMANTQKASNPCQKRAWKSPFDTRDIFQRPVDVLPVSWFCWPRHRTRVEAAALGIYLDAVRAAARISFRESC